MGGFWTNLLYWLVAALPALPFAILYLAYRRILLAKRLTVQQVMNRQEILKLYLNAFTLAGSSTKPETATSATIVATLFNLYYHWGSYVFAIALNVLITVAVSACILTRAGVPIQLGNGVAPLAHKIVPTIAFGFAGAYIWNFYDLIKRYRAVDLTPYSFHVSWLRLLVGCIVGPLVAAGATEGLRNVIAFGVGILPLPTISQFFDELTKKRLGVPANDSQRPAEGHTLYNLQGMTKDLIDRMAEEKIDSVQALAYSDPIRLFLNTDLEWIVIIDLIDQALLFIYIEQRLALLRPLGIRGCIEMAALFDRSNSDDPDRAKEARDVIERLPDKLKMDRAEINSLCRSLIDDGRVTFLWSLFFQSFSKPENA